jgi:hypothetical protein
MSPRGILSLLPVSLISHASALNGMEEVANLTLMDYLTLFIVGILILAVFAVGMQKIFQRSGTEFERTSVIYALGMFVAFLMIGLGSFSIICAVLILAAIIAKVTIFEWLALMLIQFFPQSVTVGIIVIGCGGVALFLLGVYIIVFVQGNPFLNPMGTPTKSGSPSKYELNERELEPLNPTLTFKVLDREKDEVVMDVKVILKQMNGTRYYTKYTDFNGEVVFKDIQGYGSEYFAYVEGDDKREKFRVLRKKSGE